MWLVRRVPIMQVAVALTLLVQGSKSEDLSSQWTSEPIHVDGKLDDWKDLMVTHFQDEGVVVGVANDSSHLYIQFRFQDPKWAMAIRLTGLTFWLDKKGGKHKKVGLRFTGGPTMEELRAASGREMSQGRAQDQQWENIVPFVEDKLVFFDEDYYVEAQVPMNGAKGPSAQFDTSAGFYMYEFSVPLQESGAQYYGIGAYPGQKIGVGVMWGDMKELEKQMGGGSGRMVSPPGGFGGGGSGMGGATAGGMRSGSPTVRDSQGKEKQQIKKQEIWKKTVLAKQADPVQESKL